MNNSRRFSHFHASKILQINRLLNLSLNIPISIPSLIHNHSLSVRHLNSHVPTNIHGNHVVSPSSGEERTDGPDPNEDADRDGYEECRKQQQERNADPEDNEEHGGTEREHDSGEHKAEEHGDEEGREQKLDRYESLRMDGQR